MVRVNILPLVGNLLQISRNNLIKSAFHS